MSFMCSQGLTQGLLPILVTALMLTWLWLLLAGPLAWNVGAVCNRTKFTLPMVMNSGIGLNTLGNYDACLALPEAHHCVLTVAPPVPRAPRNSSWLAATPLAMAGACVPEACGEAEIRNDAVGFLEHLSPEIAKKLGLDVAALLKDSQVDVTCSENRESFGADVTACTMGALVVILCFLVGLGTYLEVHKLKAIRGEASSSSEAEQSGLLVQVLVAFSAVKNTRDLVAHERMPTNFLNGMRYLSILWVILGHVAVFTKPGWSNISKVDEVLGNYSMVFLFGAFFAVDTFFFMSGFLQASVLPRHLLKLRRKPLHGLPLLYLLRYLRMTPPLLFLIFASRLTRYVGDGPVFHHYQRSGEWLHCEHYWWTTLLYINNFVPHDRLEMCWAWSWYLSCDFQFFLVVGPLLLAVAYGFVGPVVVILLLVEVVPIILGASSELSALNRSYFLPWNRCSPYIWGVLAALLLQRLTAASTASVGVRDVVASDDDEHRGEADLFFEEPRLPRYMWTGMTLSWVKYKGEWAALFPGATTHPWATGYDRLYGAYYVICWGVALGLLVIPWALGHGGFVKEVLGHAAFTPLSRLTFGIYLVHPLLIEYTTWQSRSYPTWTTAGVAVAFLGQTVLATMASLCLYLLVEKPAANLIALCVPMKKS